MRAWACVAALAFAPSLHAIEAGGAAPDVALVRLEEPRQPLTLASLKGSVVYVDFWASWCVPCRLSMPALDALYKQHRARGFAVVGVNKDVTAADAKRFLSKVAVSFPLAADREDAAARAFDVKAMPSGYLIDRKGVVRQVHRGFTAETGEALAREIDALLKESP